MNCLKLMTRKHSISFIVSIHQPNVEVLDMFDNLYVLSKGGVNVYSGGPQSLSQYMNDCHIDLSVNEIAIEKLLKVCANDYRHPSIVNMRAVTQNIHHDKKEHIEQEMVINTKRRNNCSYKLSLSSILYLSQRMVLIYYHTLTLPLLFFIFIFSLNGYILSTFYNFTLYKYRDCQLTNTTLECNQLFNTMTDSKNVQYEIKFLFGYTLGCFMIIGLWTSLVMSSHINVFLWEYLNG